MDDHYMDLLIELECTICTNYMSPPIRQCVTGHSICEECRKKVLNCPLCGGKFTESRNISLEALAVKMRYPCIFERLGCKVRLRYNERDVHEAKCLFNGYRYKCALETCSWIGKLEDLPQHWASKPMLSKPYQAINICHTKIRSKSYYVNMIEAYNKLFWFKCKLSDNMFYWSVQYIGNAKEAENYYYEIEFLNLGRRKQRILLSNYCHPVDIDNSALFNKTCISINSKVVESFVEEDQLLVYYMRVHENRGYKDVEATTSHPQTRNKCCKEKKFRNRSKERQYQHRNFQPKSHPTKSDEI